MTPFQRTMQLYRRYRPTSSHPLGCWDDRLWSDCVAILRRRHVQ